MDGLGMRSMILAATAPVTLHSSDAQESTFPGPRVLQVWILHASCEGRSNLPSLQALSVRDAGFHQLSLATTWESLFTVTSCLYTPWMCMHRSWLSLLHLAHFSLLPKPLIFYQIA